METGPWAGPSIDCLTRLAIRLANLPPLWNDEKHGRLAHADDVRSTRDDGSWHDVSYLAGFAGLTTSDWDRNSLAGEGEYGSKGFLTVPRNACYLTAVII